MKPETVLCIGSGLGASRYSLETECGYCHTFVQVVGRGDRVAADHFVEVAA